MPTFLALSLEPFFQRKFVNSSFFSCRGCKKTTERNNREKQPRRSSSFSLFPFDMSASDKLAVLSAKLDNLASKAHSMRNERKKQRAKPDELPMTSMHAGRLTKMPDDPLQRIPYHLKYHLQRFAAFVAIKLREFRVLDRSVKMIIVLVIGFLLFVAVFAVRGHEERGYIHSDERDEDLCVRQ